MTGVAGVIFPYQAQGSLIEKDGKVIGSALIGQVFADDKYFHGRPSATNTPDPKDSTKTVDAPYNAINSMGSNLGPTSKAMADRLKGDVDTLKKENSSAAVPVDLGDHLRQRPRPRHLAGGGTTSRCRALPRRAVCRKRVSARWSRIRSKDAHSACSASRGLTSSISISRWTHSSRSSSDAIRACLSRA